MDARLGSPAASSNVSAYSRAALLCVRGLGPDGDSGLWKAGLNSEER